MSNEDAAWRKSSYSGNNDVGNCVEVAALAASFGVRDSKDVGRGHLSVSATAWTELLASLRDR
ncbi:DUF397 domain-containing protein [Streptodolium elevatio]|uniref:DUF397 domain-containing protein n=1 Tax=Streptodolium elevatio TaxID=3157996 RepID=A0ABV3D9B3_9ACTN